MAAIPAFAPKGKAVTVLAVNPYKEDHTALRSILPYPEWVLQIAWNLKDAMEWISSGSVAVVICERELAEGNWERLIRQTETLQRPPRFIVSSRLVDQGLWAEVLSCGGYDVLCTPFDAFEVLQTVQTAWHSWHHQWTTRPPSRVRPAIPAHRQSGAA